MPSHVALTTSTDAADARLSPFFSLTPWVMLIATDGGAPVTLRNVHFNAGHVIDLIASWSPRLVICGHVPAAAAGTMRDAGIEVRIGPCSVPAVSLIDRAHTLPCPIFPGDPGR